jgi:hypothetical protein
LECGGAPALWDAIISLHDRNEVITDAQGLRFEPLDVRINAGLAFMGALFFRQARGKRMKHVLVFGFFF